MKQTTFRRWRQRILTCGFVGICASTTACYSEHDHSSHEHDVAETMQTVHQGTSEQKRYTVAWATTPATVTAGVVFSVETTLNDAAGLPAEGVTLTVDAFMPMHGHGMEGVKPVTAPVAGKKGVYRTEGMRLQMPGQWQLRFEMKGGAGDDKAALPLFAG